MRRSTYAGGETPMVGDVIECRCGHDACGWQGPIVVTLVHHDTHGSARQVSTSDGLTGDLSDSLYLVERQQPSRTRRRQKVSEVIEPSERIATALERIADALERLGATVDPGDRDRETAIVVRPPHDR